MCYLMFMMYPAEVVVADGAWLTLHRCVRVRLVLHFLVLVAEFVLVGGVSVSPVSFTVHVLQSATAADVK